MQKICTYKKLYVLLPRLTSIPDSEERILSVNLNTQAQ